MNQARSVCGGTYTPAVLWIRLGVSVVATIHNLMSGESGWECLWRHLYVTYISSNWPRGALECRDGPLLNGGVSDKQATLTLRGLFVNVANNGRILSTCLLCQWNNAQTVAHTWFQSEGTLCTGVRLVVQLTGRWSDNLTVLPGPLCCISRVEPATQT